MVEASSATALGGPALASVELTKKIDSYDYEKRLADQQLLLRQIQQAYLGSCERGIVVFEGWDAPDWRSQWWAAPPRRPDR